MVMTESTMLPLGTQAPAFELPDVVSGRTISLASFADCKGLLVMFICQHCPFVKHVQAEIARLGVDYGPQGIGMVAISANDVEHYPADGPANLKAMAMDLNFTFPYCYDADQTVAQAYTAACTPDFFVFNGQRQLVYRGQLDDSRPSNGKPVTGTDLRAALDAVVAGQTVSEQQRPSIGCNIKWKPNNEPSYFGA